jgi:hypothetical protein
MSLFFVLMLSGAPAVLAPRISIIPRAQQCVKKNFLILPINISSRKGIDMLTQACYNLSTERGEQQKTKPQKT